MPLGPPSPGPATEETLAEPPDTSLSIYPPPVGGVIGPSFSLRGYSFTADRPAVGARCRLDDGVWQECAADRGVAFTGVPGGPHVVEAAAYDASGQVDPTPASKSITVDDEGPVGGPVLIDGGVATVGRLTWHLDMPATDPHGVARATVSIDPPNADGMLTDGFRYSMDAWAATGYTFDYAAHGGSSDPGQKTIWVQWEDEFWNASRAVSATVLYDPTHPPVARWDAHVSQTHVPLGEPAYVRGRLRASDGARVTRGDTRFTVAGHPEWTVDSEAANDSTWALDASFLPADAGTYEGTFTFFGGDGLEPVSQSVSIVVGPDLDTRPPNTWIGGGASPGPRQITYAFSSERGTSFECSLDDSAWVACTATWTTPILSDGLHVLAVRSVSAAGVRDATPAVTAPTVPLDALPGWVSPGVESTRQTVVSVTLHSDSPDVDLVRVSGSSAVDSSGRLATGVDTPMGPGQGDVHLPWNLVDPANGSTPGDGAKLIMAQWHRLDGSWTPVVASDIVLDTTPPQVAMVVADDAGYVDDDELYVLLGADERAAFSVGTTPGGYETRVGGYSESCAYAATIAPVAPGTIAERTVTVFASDQLGNTSQTFSTSVVIDRSSPTAMASPPIVVLGRRVTSTQIPVRLAGRTSDTGAGIASSTLQASISGAAYATVAQAASASVGATRSLAPGRTVVNRVRGVDRLGHVGSWVRGSTTKVALYSDGSSLIRYTGWSRAAQRDSLGGSVHRTTKAGARAVVRFSGRGFALVAPTGPRLGRVAVTIDGVSAGTFDLRRRTSATRVVVVARSWPASRSHVIVLRALGTRGRPTVAVDGLVVLR